MKQYCSDPEIRMRRSASDRSSVAGPGRSVKFFGKVAKDEPSGNQANAAHLKP
jgi:hypothetical protein